MVGRCISYWECLFSGAKWLVSGSVTNGYWPLEKGQLEKDNDGLSLTSNFFGGTHDSFSGGVVYHSVLSVLE